jgi:molybdenum cofactor guanylyltransferase
MGREKSLLEIAGTPLVVRAARRVLRVCAVVTIVGRPELYERFGFPCIPDLLLNSGPLAGILAALTHTSSPWNLIVACDMPYLTEEWLRFLIARAQASRAQIVLPISDEGPEPLCAAYHRGAAAIIQAETARGVLKVTRALESLRIERIEPDEIKPFDPRGVLFQNLNVLEDYERARADLE